MLLQVRLNPLWVQDDQETQGKVATPATFEASPVSPLQASTSGFTATNSTASSNASSTASMAVPHTMPPESEDKKAGPSCDSATHLAEEVSCPGIDSMQIFNRQIALCLAPAVTSAHFGVIMPHTLAHQLPCLLACLYACIRISVV